MGSNANPSIKEGNTLLRHTDCDGNERGDSTHLLLRECCAQHYGTACHDEVETGCVVEMTGGQQCKRDGETRQSAKATYVRVLRTNRSFRLYLLSYCVTHVGEWLSYVAAISVTEAIAPNSQTAVSVLVMLRLIPNIIFASFGGALSDGTDRRLSMITLDLIGAVVALLYLLVLNSRLRSLMLLFGVTFLQATIAAIYEPVRSAIVPLLVPDEESLQKATTLSGLAWSLMQAVGASMGGVVASALGLEACFQLDCVTYLLSALLMWQVGGTWCVARKDDKEFIYSRLSPVSLLRTYKSMSMEGVAYLRSISFAVFVFLKASAALVFGAADVLNVSFSHRNEDANGDSRRLGILFGFVGIGCLLGPLVADRFTDMKRPRTLQGACVFSFALLALGYAGMGSFDSFHGICFFNVLRASGSSMLWVDSTLLLQKYSSPEMLGRVLSVDYAFATLCEAASAFSAGVLEDHFNLTAVDVSWVMGAFSAILFLLWYFLYAHHSIDGRMVVGS